jgi:FkbM family methyltransferase
MNRKHLARTVYGAASRYPSVVTAALRIRNVTNALAGQAMVFGHAPSNNGEERLIRQMLPGAKTVFDVGANVGDWAALALPLLADDARLVCFEPSYTAADRLAARLGSDARVEIVQCALSDRSGERIFYEEPDAGEASSLLRANTRGGAAPRPVHVSTVDAEAERLAITHIDMLKVDAEGFDLYVLRGAERHLSTSSIGVVQFEYNHPWALAGATLGGAIGLLTQYGYSLMVVTPYGLSSFDYGRFGETFTYANFAAIAPNQAS